MQAAARRDPDRRLLSARMALLVWLPIAVVTVGHFTSPPDLHWVHDVLRRAYYLPIVLAALLAGLRGAAAAVVVVVAAYYPHAFATVHHFDPADGLEKVLEIVLYVAMGGVAGWLTDRERQRRIELERAIEELRVLQDQLVRAGRLSALGEVVAGIAHEIKNPLHALAGTAEVIDPLVPRDCEERRLWEIHVSEIRRLQRTAERFLSFARPGVAELRPLDLRDVAGRLAELIGADARGRGVEVETVLPDHAVTVHGDRDPLAQVGLNIAVNALEALAGRPGRLRIAVEAGEAAGRRTGVLVLENDGPPIPVADLEQMFDPFHSGRNEGTGLGLSISARIVELHGGVIEVANAGLGVRFRVVLPASSP